FATDNMGCCYYTPTNKIYVFGGYNLASGHIGPYVQIYDVATNTWTYNATLPMSSYGTAASQLGNRMYVLFGSPGAGAFYEYDPATNAWTSRAPLSGHSSHGELAEKNGFMYGAGGWSAQNIFARYSPSSNSWTTLTSLPAGRHGFGMDSSWTKIYVYAGGNSWWTPVNSCYSWDVMAGGWTYEGDVLQTHIGGGYGYIISGGFGRLHAVGGYNTSVPSNYHERGTTPPPPIGVALAGILAPVGVIDSGQTINPSVLVQNRGLQTASFRTYITIQGGYAADDTVDQLVSMAYDTVSFPDWTANARDSLNIVAWTVWAPDSFNMDDTARARILVRVKDVAVTGILAPLDTLDSGLVVYPQCRVWNYGNVVQSFQVQFQIGSWTSTANVVNLIPGGQTNVTAPNPYTTMPGVYIHRVTAILVGDLHPENNTMVDTFYVRGTLQHDIAALAVLAPVGMIETTEVVTPQGRVANLGTATETFWAFFTVNDETDSLVYIDSLQMMLAPGDTFDLSFTPTQFTVEGTYRAACSTYTVGDQNGLNDVAVGRFIVGGQLGNDIGVTDITEPAGTVDTSEVVTPTAKWRNYGLNATGFRAFFFLINPLGTRVYSEFIDVVSLGVGVETTLVFPDYNVGLDEGTWVARCSTFAAGDTVVANDVREERFTVQAGGTPPWPEGWVEVQQMPSAPSGKAAKDGAWLALDPSVDGGLYYAAKGNKTSDFYSFDPEAGTWTSQTPIPDGAEAKKPKKGAAGCVGEGFIYATKGNNTLGFWRYAIDSLTWSQMPDVPLGTSGKKVKGGTDMVYVTKGDTGFVYLLKGYKQEFLRYNTLTSAWEALPDAPPGAKAKWDKGSWLVYDEVNGLIYAHKAKYHEMYAFDVEAGTWGSLIGGMPFTGSLGKKKKSKDGGSGAYYDGAIYALKGGNTCEFWKFDIAGNAWTERPLMPEVGSTGKKKRVKAGGDLAAFGSDRAFFALKGNKTLETWRYVESMPAAYQPRVERSGAASRPQARKGYGFTLAPNPLKQGLATLSYSLPGAGVAAVTVFDVTGRALVLRSLAAGRTGTAVLDLKGLSAGVYLVKLEASGYTATSKLIVQ
ncbi:T9SS type A sorting domain-containing protein, partial [candidate division WOR-3 bacterium]|nr:T9SS type A sorting domain-containing protein [candidate division WOR-3 bacterium]